MSSVTLAPSRRPFGLTPRRQAGALGLVLAALVFAFGLRLSPQGALSGSLAVALAVAGSALLYVLTADEDEEPFIARSFLIAGAIVLAAFVSGLKGAALEPAFALLSLGLASASAYRSAAANRARKMGIRKSVLLLGAGVAIGLLAYNAWYVWASRDLEIADFMFFRVVSVAVAVLVDSGRLPQLAFQIATSLKSDYTWIAAILPGLALASGAPLSRAVYQTAIMVFYGAPALLALGWLARELAVRAGLEPRLRHSTAMIALGVLAVAAAYPTGLAVAARGMPDIGGLALYVYALRTADCLARSAATPRARALTVRLALTLALTFFAMLVFRRWYAFAAIGVMAALGLELLGLAIVRRGRLAWGSLFKSGALAALMSLALLSPILVDWAADPGKHDYGSLYAAYRKPTDVFLGLIGDWWGFGVLALGAIAFAALFVRSPKGRLARMTLVAALVAAALFLRIQTPYVHHVFLVVPCVAAIGALVLLIAQASPVAGAVTLAALAAATLTPIGALAPKGVFPSYGQPHPPRSDLAELARMKDWVDGHATSASKVCGLGSSYTFSGQLIDELWQLKAGDSPLRQYTGQRTNVTMSDVDTVEGPPAPAMKDCAWLLVGDPVQTHLDPAYQVNVTLPSREMLEGTGIGTHYTRTDEAFRLEHGVSAIVFRQIAPLTDADMADLAGRWRAARSR